MGFIRKKKVGKIWLINLGDFEEYIIQASKSKGNKVGIYVSIITLDSSYKCNII